MTNDDRGVNHATGLKRILTRTLERTLMADPPTSGQRLAALDREVTFWRPQSPQLFHGASLAR
jgi:hypothetical protein